MAIEVGKSVLKLSALVMGGIGSIYLISLGHIEAGSLGIGTIVGFAVGDANGHRNGVKDVLNELGDKQPEEL